MLYSRLEFSYQIDRCVAIRGLEKRLIRSFNTVGAHGIFEQHLNRSLLWERGGDQWMQVIHYPASRRVPTWSWMAYRRWITYVDIPFGKVEWLQNIRSPFIQASQNIGDKDVQALELLGTAKKLDLSIVPVSLLSPTIQTEACVTFDTEDKTNSKDLMGLVAARDKAATSGNNKKYYVLLIGPLDGHGAYQGVGTGIMAECQIDFSGPVFNVRVL
jgi:hypothetical protein